MKDRLDVVMEEKQGDSRLVNPEEDFKSLGDAEANQERGCSHHDTGRANFPATNANNPAAKAKEVKVEIDFKCHFL